MVTVLGGWIVVEVLLFSVFADGIPEFADSDESASVLAFLDPFNCPTLSELLSIFRFMPALFLSLRFKDRPMRARWAT